MRLDGLHFGKDCNFLKDGKELDNIWVGTVSSFDTCLVGYWLQEDQYDHLDAVDLVRVEKSTNEAMEWMNNKLNLQNKQSLTVDPVVKAKEIEAKIKVMYDFKDLIVFSSQSHYLLLRGENFIIASLLLAWG